MPRQLWIADVCREWGLEVVEVPGWRERGSDAFHPRGVIAHHTAGPPMGDYPSLHVVRDGRPGLPGPLSQVGLGRYGSVYVIAAGRANHAGRGGWRGLSGNYSVMGIEAESVGTRDDWTPEQREAYPLLCAALLDGIGQPAAMLCGHKEWAPTRKVDPFAWDMDRMRADVAALIARGPRPPTPPQREDDDMARLVQDDTGRIYLVAGVSRSYIGDPATVQWLAANGHVPSGTPQRIPTAVLRDAYPITANDPQAGQGV